MSSSFRASRLPMLALLLATLAAVSGCGQKGPLFMPPAEQQSAGAGEQGDGAPPPAAAGEQVEQDPDAPATGG